MREGPRSSSPTRALLPQLSSLEEGFGSAYERYAVGLLLEDFVSSLGVHRVAEWPANGVLGVPGLKSLPLAFAGCDVTLLNPSEALLDGALRIWRAAKAKTPRTIVGDPEVADSAHAGTFDLVWSFCAFEHARSPERLAEAMVNASRRYVLVFVQNAWMPGVHLHGLQHRFNGQSWDHGSLRSMRAGAVAGYLEKAGARVARLGGCDLPPWPDLDVRLPRPRTARNAALRGGSRPYGPGDPVLPPHAAAKVFESPKALSLPMRFLSAWHDYVESHLPGPMLRLLAHHPYVLAEKT